MRWSEQTIEQDAATRLPGYREPAVERHFEAPEAMDRVFYEVRAKSALNRVPKASQVPFKWTINPYRGCTHACVYCAVGETPIPMADGRTRPLADLRVGDEIYGTEARGRSRRYVRTTVRAHWSTDRRAYRTTLADGTELVTSGDHRFLTERGWKHVTAAERAGPQRPYLTEASRLVGPGRIAAPPEAGPEYRRGYVCGIVRGDRRLRSRQPRWPGGRDWRRDGFGLALAESSALPRAWGRLEGAHVLAHEFAFAGAGDERRPARADTLSADTAEAARQLVAWPEAPSDAWRRGFLAGVVAAAGGWDGEAVRIFGADPDVLRWTDRCLRGLGFDTAVDPPSGNGCPALRVRGGLSEGLRLLHSGDPAAARGRDIEGRAVEAPPELAVVSVEDLGVVLPMYDITTGTGDFIAAGVVSHNCFARPTHEYLDMDAGRDFERRIVVKVNVPEVLRAELARPSWAGEHVALGTNTDPYQWVEGRYKLMRGIWAALRDARNPCSILTKSPLVLRDADLLREIREVADVSACLSVPTLDEKAWRATEPGTPNPRARLEAVAELNRQGIPTGILIAPLMPGINDAPEQVERIIELATEAGAVSIGGNTLFLAGAVRGIFFEWLRAHRPDLVGRYERLYARGAWAPAAERRKIERAAGLPGKRLRPYAERFTHRVGAARRTPAAVGPPASPASGRGQRVREVAQGTLF